MIQLKEISYQIAGKTLLKNINWTINPKKRVALIGPNGAGKTTLLRLINQELPLQEGEIQKPKNFSIGYLPQEEISFGRESVLAETLQADRNLQNLEKKMAILHEKLDDNSLSAHNQMLLTNQLGLLQGQFSIQGGYEFEARAKKILMGLGFRESDFSDPISRKSGGWRMRVYLARLLLQDPDLLLLDEPTNHLDIDSLEWLENFLTDFRGSMIIVSHDRFFIDRLANEIAEIENKILIHYPGKYAYYEDQKVLHLEQLIQKAERIKTEKERLIQFINRFRYKASKAVQVQDRVKRLEKLESVEIPKAPPRISFQIVCAQKSYKDVCQLKEVTFRYTDAWVFQNVNLNLYRGEKAALVGANGEGKTTLTRLITRQLIPQKGHVLVGERAVIGYYAQHQIDNLNPEKTVHMEVEEAAAEIYRIHIRDILGVFKLSGEDINKKIAVLSGGEKARVSLAKMLLSPANFLIMDEPTNHLDIHSKEALEKALLNYDGTLLLISHDRYFLDKLVTIVFELKDGRLRRFEGNYSDYLKKRTAEKQLSDDNIKNSNGDKLPERRDKEKKRLEAQARQQISKKRKTLSENIEKIEKEIELLEEEKKDIEQLMADPEFYRNEMEVAKKGKKYQELQGTLPQLYAQWETIHAELEDLLKSIQNYYPERPNNEIKNNPS